jgi:hypothetical protein
MENLGMETSSNKDIEIPTRRLDSKIGINFEDRIGWWLCPMKDFCLSGVAISGSATADLTF